MTAYIDLVCAEIRATKRLGQQPLQTVSFGGGVSSLLWSLAMVHHQQAKPAVAQYCYRQQSSVNHELGPGLLQLAASILAIKQAVALYPTKAHAFACVLTKLNCSCVMPCCADSFLDTSSSS